MVMLLMGMLLLGAALARQPNILFILTDDQDNHMGATESMHALQKHIVAEGTAYNRHYCTTALCCPSRASLWTGRLAHNTNVTSVKPPFGGYQKVLMEGINNDYLPIWMQNAGYNTYYIGKLWNAYGADFAGGSPAKGWTGSEILIDPYTYRYYDSAFSRNGGKPKRKPYKGQYSPDIVNRKSRAFLKAALKSDKPFFMVAAPVAPHAQVEHTAQGKKKSVPPPCAKRHQNLFRDYTIPRTPNFNPDKPSGAAWVRKLPVLSGGTVRANDHYQGARMRALQSVDDMIGDLIADLKKHQVLDDTYVIFSTDNGFHISQYRLLPGKKLGFETDIHIPLYIRGPGVPKGAQTTLLSTHTDIAPTIMSLAGQSSRRDFDGSPIPLTAPGIASHNAEITQVEFWGSSSKVDEGDEERAVAEGKVPNTYKSVRLIGDGYNLYYSVWCTHEHEMYDMTVDSAQLVNLFQHADKAADFKLFGRGFKAVYQRLDALTMVLKSCAGDSCRHPWKTIHPGGQVNSLREALATEHDAFYARQPSVKYSACSDGYIISKEGPQHLNFNGQAIDTRSRDMAASDIAAALGFDEPEVDYDLGGFSVSTDDPDAYEFYEEF